MKTYPASPRFTRGRLARAWAPALVGVALAAPAAARADEAAKLPVVTFNPAAGAFENILPHRTPFLIQIPATGARAEFDQVSVRYWEAGDKGCDPEKDPQRVVGSGGDYADSKRTFTIPMPRLRYAQGYCFKFTLSRGFSDKFDKPVVLAAMRDAFVFAAKSGQYDDAAITKQLTTALGDRARLQVELAASPGKTKDLAIVLAQRFFDASSGEAVGPSKEAQGRWLDYYAALEGLHRQGKSLVGLKANAHDKDLFGAQQPAEVDAFDAAFAAASSAATALGFDKDISAAEKKRDKEPASPSAGEEALGDATAVLREKAKAVKAKLCTAAAAKKDAQKKFCANVEKASNAATEVADQLDHKNAAATRYTALVNQLLDQVKEGVGHLQVTIETDIAASQRPTYTERANFYVSADVGIAMPVFNGGGVDLAPFVGVNFYFTGVDKDVPLREDDTFLKRFSLMGGITLTPVRDNKNTVEGIVNGNALLAGGGFRMTDYLRLGGGLVFLRQSDENPVATGTKHVRVTGYGAVSIDVDVAGIVTGSLAKFKN